jgi:hypothetical protein
LDTAAAVVGLIGRDYDVERVTGLDGRDAVGLPTRQYRSHKGVAGALENGIS